VRRRASAPLADRHAEATIEIVFPDGCRLGVGSEVGLPALRVWLASGVTDMRKAFDGLAALAQQHLLRRFRAAVDDIFAGRIERVMLFSSRARGEA
jgi:hypothetical protein